jgi:hypothetical protein
MSVKPVALTPIVSAASEMPEATSRTKVSKFVQDDKFPSPGLPTKAPRYTPSLTAIDEVSSEEESSVEEIDARSLEPLPTAQGIVNSPAPKQPKIDFRKLVLLNNVNNLK